MFHSLNPRTHYLPFVQWIYTDHLADGVDTRAITTALATNNLQQSIRPFHIDMLSMVNNPLYSDVVLIVGGHRVFAHRVVLCCRSIYWNKLLNSPLAGKREAEVVVDTEAPLEVFLEVVKYLYTGM